MFKEVLTGPRKHKPNDFIYLVHGLMDYRNNGITAEDVTHKIRKINSTGKFYSASMVGHMDKKSAKQRVGWCGGELYRMFTFGNVGFIIKPANDEDIKIAWYCGLGSPSKPKELKEFVEQHEGKIRNPLCIFTKSMNIDDVLGDNEFTVEGNPKTQIQGVFYRNDYQASKDAKMVRDVAGKILQSNLPIIQLPNSKISKLSPLAQTAVELQKQQLLGEFYRPELCRMR